MPTFLLYEDPENNRRLSSQTAKATALYPVGTPAVELTLIADRRRYDLTQKMLLYVGCEPMTAAPSDISNATLTFECVDPDSGQADPSHVVADAAAADVSVRRIAVHRPFGTAKFGPATDLEDARQAEGGREASNHAHHIRFHSNRSRLAWKSKS